MRYALSFSGGKDSMLALDRSVLQGLDVARLFNIAEGTSDRVRFHGVRTSLIAAQAASIGIPLLQDFTHPDSYEVVFLRTMDQLRDEGIGGVIFGNIHLSDIRAWYEERTSGHGFLHLEPLWNVPGPEILQEIIGRGYVARLVSIDVSRTPATWLGRLLDKELMAEIQAHPEIDVCGERGEYHTFVSDGPLFETPLEVLLSPGPEIEGHALVEVSLAQNEAV